MTAAVLCGLFVAVQGIGAGMAVWAWWTAGDLPGCSRRRARNLAALSFALNAAAALAIIVLLRGVLDHV